MPIYEYICRSCGHVSERLVQGFSGPDNPECPQCGRQMERIITTPTLIKNPGSSGTTCCGREERCEKPPCSTGNGCRKQ